jgi:hypothetical protein
VEAAISLLSSKLQSGPSDADRGFYTALLSELCLVEEDCPNSVNSSFYYGHRLKCRSGSDTSSRLGGAMRGAVDAGVGGNAGAEACEPSAVAVRRVSALSAALCGVIILRKVCCDYWCSANCKVAAVVADCVARPGSYRMFADIVSGSLRLRLLPRCDV